jgi:catechol 2,3-dioxygenase-like lactoylglutathione lyase family enzyme
VSLEKTHIRLDVEEASESIAFYVALLGAPPTGQSGTSTVFALASSPVVLTVEARPRPMEGSDPSKRPQREAPAHGARTRFSFLVPEPQNVGDAAVRLRRAGVRLRIEDQGILVQDPDGNAWRVRFVPRTRGPTIVAT